MVDATKNWVGLLNKAEAMDYPILDMDYGELVQFIFDAGVEMFTKDIEVNGKSFTLVMCEDSPRLEVAMYTYFLFNTMVKDLTV